MSSWWTTISMTKVWLIWKLSFLMIAFVGSVALVAPGRKKLFDWAADQAASQ